MVIRKVIVDSFGTLMSPKSPGVIGQYARVAAAKGVYVNQDKLRGAFGQAFRKWNTSHPLYGKLSSPPMNSQDWWRNVIRDAFLAANVNTRDFKAAEAELLDALLRRFASKSAYTLHSDVLPFLAKLEAYSRRKGRHFMLPPAVASGSDLSCLSVLRALGVLPLAELGGRGPGLERGGLAEVYTTWEIEREKKDVRFWDEVRRMVSEESEARGGRAVGAGEMVVVGDDLRDDYLVPREAGFRALLLRRPAEVGGEEAVRALHNLGKPEAEEEAEKVANLVEVVEYVKRVNQEEML